ncbi:MAG TPA: glycosyltransferase 87 family protein [Ktedonobacterales bacterium]|nr:glycosyltransferase 87 family protein [Ktedonobacterales bacterium]
MRRHEVSLSRLPYRAIALIGLALVALPLYQRIRDVAERVGQQGSLFLWPGLGVTLVAVAAAWLVLRATPQGAAERPFRAVRRRTARRGVELALIVAGGLAFRLIFATAAPALSHDAYRYVWDAHLVAHGASPYTHTVSDPALAPLRDAAIWPQVNWRDAPTIYPPGAQLFYLLVNAIAPLNIWAMKLAMGLCDALAGLLTIVLLRQHGLDPRRSIIYWWNPIPILEFGFNGHVDAAATLWTLAALVVAGQRWRGARPAAGVFLGLAALTKLYPLLLAVALVRRRDWGFLLGLAGTLVVVTVPFVRLGLGSGGFLATYFSQRFVDQGLAFRVITTFITDVHVQTALQGLLLLAVVGVVAWLHLWRGLSPEAGVLALSAGWILVAPHLFPWYVAGLLPLLALYVRLPLLGWRVPMATTTGRADAPADLAGKRPTQALALWLFTLAMPFTYVIFAPEGSAGLFPFCFVVPLALAAYPLVARWIHGARMHLPATTTLRPATQEE